MTSVSEHLTDSSGDIATGRLVYKQKLATRITHWIWAVCLFFLLLSGLQIFNAHPTLYIGQQSGFDFSNAVVDMTGEDTPAGPKGFTTVFGHKFDTTGILGLSKQGNSEPTAQGFPAWATIPSTQDLATGRVIHFFFAWILVTTLMVWLVASIVNGHLWRDIVPGKADFRRLPRDILDHLKLRFTHTRDYNTLQKLSYAGVLFVLFPTLIITGLCMSPGMSAFMPWLVELLGRQTARTIHFSAMALLVAFFVIHILMVFAAGPINEMRSMVTGWYRSSKPTDTTSKEA